MWINIHPVTVFLSITSLLMNFSTTIIINLSLDITNSALGFVFIKSLSKASGYIGKFLVGWISDVFQCNKLILKIGYGSIFIIKPMFYLAMMNFFSNNLHNLYLITIADCLDQFFNNFRDISRDAMIARTVKSNHLSRNLFFRKASAIAGTMIGAILGLYISIFHKINKEIFGALSVVLMVAVATSIVGYGFLIKSLKYVDDKVQPTKFYWSNVLDIRLWSLINTLLVLIISLTLKVHIKAVISFTVILFGTYIGSSLLHRIYCTEREEEIRKNEDGIIEESVSKSVPIYSMQNRLYLFDNRTFVFVGILSLFLSLFNVNYYSLIDVFKEIMHNNENIALSFANKPWTQIMAIIYYIISFVSSSVLSIINMKKISNILFIYLTSVIIIGTMVMTKTFIGFIIAIISYGVINGVFESAINAYIIRHTQKFAYKGITLGLFSVFNSIGIILILIISQYLENVYSMYKFALIGNISIASMLFALSHLKKDKLKEI